MIVGLAVDVGVFVKCAVTMGLGQRDRRVRQGKPGEARAIGVGFRPVPRAGESPVATLFKMTRAVPTDTLKRIASLRFCFGRLTLPFFAEETSIRHRATDRCADIRIF